MATAFSQAMVCTAFHKCVSFCRRSVEMAQQALEISALERFRTAPEASLAV